MTTKSITAIATMLLALCATDATAQTANEGRKVKQLRFDKEKVTIVYNNGDTEEATDDIVIHRSEATPIKEVANNKSSDSKSPGTWYTIDGRKIENKKSSNTKLPKGVYVKKEGKIGLSMGELNEMFYDSGYDLQSFITELVVYLNEGADTDGNTVEEGAAGRRLLCAMQSVEQTPAEEYEQQLNDWLREASLLH